MSQSNKYLQELQSVKSSLATDTPASAQLQTTAHKPYFKFSEIPTKNKLQVIDNYSPKYNYIVEGDKIYYALKGKDYWVDISSNQKARQNLLQFLSDRYDFKGYEDGEKEGYLNLIGQNKPQAPKEPKQKELPKIEGLPELKKEIPTMAMDATLVAPQMYKKPAGSDATETEDPWLVEKLKLIPEYIKRKKALWFPDGEAEGEDPQGTIKEDPIDVTGAVIRASQSTSLGDTVKIDSRKYVLPESTVIGDYEWGFRNRKDYTPIQNTPGGHITTFHPFVLKQNYGRSPAENETFLGISPQGTFKAGSFSEFQDGDYVTKVFSNDLIGFKLDANGDIEYQKSQGRFVSPKVIFQLPDGRQVEKTWNTFLTYGNTPQARASRITGASGGKVIFQVGDNDFRLVSGSIGQIYNEFERLKREYNLPYIKAYTLDNGSFNYALKTYDQNLTSLDLKQWDGKNNGGGNFLYIKGVKTQSAQFASDTVWTPNIRTTESDSYKKGHPLQNEVKGVVLHHTAFTDPSGAAALKHMTNPKTEASAHVLIGYDGKRTVMATPEQVTFHAGSSMFGDRMNVNDFMLGIEFQGDTGRRPLTEQQIQSAVEYLKPIILKYRIPLSSIVTHQNVRDAYNEYAAKNGMKRADKKVDINPYNYQRIIEALLKEVYYIPQNNKFGGRLNYLNLMNNDR